MALDVLVANLQLLPSETLAPQKEIRLLNFFNYIGKVKPQVVMLQEVWTKEFVDRIRQQLSDEYFLVSPKVGFIRGLSLPGFHHTGLLTLVRKESEIAISPDRHKAKLFTRFEVGLIDEFLARKGALLIFAEWEGMPIVLVNTHLHARHYGSKRLPLKQFVDLVLFLRGYKEDEILLGGDFNITPAEIDKAMTGMGMDYAVADNDDPDIKPDNPYQHMGVSGVPIFTPWKLLRKHKKDIHLMSTATTRISHIVTFGPRQGIKIHSQTLYAPEQLWSDHYGILFQIVNSR